MPSNEEEAEVHEGCRRLPRAACHGLTRDACHTALLLMLTSWLGGCDAAWPPPPPPRPSTITSTPPQDMTRPCVASKLAEANQPAACPPQWLPVLLANSPVPPTHRRLLEIITTNAKLKTAVGEYDANVAATELKYGPIADWDVSVITDMSYLFDSLSNFNADISRWNTSSVTDMSYIFQVRFRFRPHTPKLRHARTPRRRALLIRPSLCAIIVPRVNIPIGCPLWTRQYAVAFNQPLRFNTASVTSMSSMFFVRFHLRLLPMRPSWATHARRVCC